MNKPTESIETRVRQVFALLFKTDFPLGADIKRTEFEKWDSLKHVELIFALEDEFGVSFDMEKMPKLNSLSIIVDEIGQHHAS